MATKTQHIHKLKRVTYKSGNAIFFCCLPDCSFKINPALALGKRAICWRCGNEFLMNDYSLRLAKPHCDSCHRPKNSKADKTEEVPWVHTPSEQEVEATQELVRELSLAEKLELALKRNVTTDSEDI